jgi:hypothetical protein
MWYILIKVFDILDHHLIRMVVYQDVYATHLLDSLLNDLLAVLAVLQVGRVCVALLSLLLDQLDGLLRIVLLLGQVGDEAVGALHREEDGHGASNARVATCDDGLLALELACSLVEFAATVSGGEVVDLWRRVHDGLPSGDFLVLYLGLMAYSDGLAHL